MRKTVSISVVRFWTLCTCLPIAILFGGTQLLAQGLANTAETRIALVIGNSDYPNVPLKNPVNDARDTATTLGTIGFSVTLLEDVDLASMNRAVRDFGNAIKRPDAVALFYFSGHGVQYGGANYLVPARADIQSADELPYSAMNVEQIYAKMESSGAATNLIILDACRNNPFPGAERALERGLTIVGNVQPPRSLIIYSTAPGKTAQDGEGRNSVFTTALLKHLLDPGLDAELMIRRVRDDVIASTNGAQVPWHNSSLTGKGFFFAGGTTEAILDPEKLLATYSSEFDGLAALETSLSFSQAEIDRVDALKIKALAQPSQGFQDLGAKAGELSERLTKHLAMQERKAQLDRLVAERSLAKRDYEKNLETRRTWARICLGSGTVALIACGLIYIIGAGVANSYAGAQKFPNRLSGPGG
jgi:hypothetical protein